jgi:hypothetical protein
VTLKLFGLIPRRKDLGKEEFHDYYRHPHGTMGLAVSTLRGYVQSHQIDTNRLGDDQGTYDAVAEIWIDNIADILGFREEPSLVKYIIDDEPKFIDMPNLAFLAAEMEVLTSGPQLNAGLHPGDEMWSLARRPLSVKILQFIATDGNPDWATRDDEGLGLRLGAFRHTRGQYLQAVHGEEPAFLGVRELWWPTRTAFHRAIDDDPEALQSLLLSAGKSVTMLVQAERFI